MADSEQPKAGWAFRLPKDSMKESLRSLADSSDEAETTYYEWAADPTADANDRARRRLRAMYRRSLRHRASRRKTDDYMPFRHAAYEVPISAGGIIWL